MSGRLLIAATAGAVRLLGGLKMKVMESNQKTILYLLQPDMKVDCWYQVPYMERERGKGEELRKRGEARGRRESKREKGRSYCRTT